MPPIGERAIAFTGIVPRRFQAICDTTEHDFRRHGLSQLDLVLCRCDDASLTCRNRLHAGAAG